MVGNALPDNTMRKRVMFCVCLLRVDYRSHGRLPFVSSEGVRAGVALSMSWLSCREGV